MVEEKKVKEKVVKEKQPEKRKPTNKDNKKTKGHDKQTKIAVTIMIVLLASVFLAHWIVQESKKFEYNGLKFYKEKEGAIMYYKSLLGYVTAGGNIPFILKLRNDPRDLDKITVEGDIILKKEVILSLSPKIANCSNTYVTMIDFSRTLKAFSIKARAATTDKKYAREHNATFANCKSTRLGTIIVMKESNETRITRNKDCYIIEIKDCEIQESFERFMLEFIGNSMIRI